MVDPVSRFSHTVQVSIRDRDVIVFDGVCVLCSGFFRFMLARDGGRFAFVTAQSPVGQAMYRDLGLPTEAFETNLVIVDGQVHQRLGAFAAAMGTLAWPWRALAVARFIPEPLKSWAYHRVARNRYKIFGRTDTCVVPTPDIRARFLDLGAAA
ncbi:MAG: DCC1-like thiol-disulfide oxidoreductase family protein [Pseudomonadota bacterium]